MRKFLIAAGLVLAPAAAFAQGSTSTIYGPTQGEWEATLSGTGTSDDSFDNHNLGVSGSVGQYLTDNVLVGGRQSVTYADVEEGDDNWNGSTRVFADYVFNLGRFRPYIGASIGAVYGDTVDDGFAAGPEAGVKYYADQNTFIFAQTEYQYGFDSDSDDNFQHAIGVGFNF